MLVPAGRRRFLVLRHLGVRCAVDYVLDGVVTLFGRSGLDAISAISEMHRYQLTKLVSRMVKNTTVPLTLPKGSTRPKHASYIYSGPRAKKRAAARHPSPHARGEALPVGIAINQRREGPDRPGGPAGASGGRVGIDRPPSAPIGLLRSLMGPPVPIGLPCLTYARPEERSRA